MSCRSPYATTSTVGAYNEQEDITEAVRGTPTDLFGEYAGWAQLVMFAADLADLNNNGVNE